MRRRGLKPVGLFAAGFCSGVASRAEAWIETTRNSDRLLHQNVASRAEAWIETLRSNLCQLCYKSPPVRRRGLKPKSECCLFVHVLSPPVRRRGLKPDTRKYPSARGCVASRAEAWIETERKV